VVVRLLLRERGFYPNGLSDSWFVTKVSEYDWFCGAAQLSIPRYRSVYAHLAARAETGNTGDEESLARLESIATRCRHLLRVHDQLGLLQPQDGWRGKTDNLGIMRQTESYYNAVDAATGMLEGLAVLAVQLEGKLAEGSDQWGQVTYGNLRICERSSARGLAKYADSVTAARSSWTPLLSTISSDRIQGFHYFPILGRSIQFGSVVQRRSPDGTSQPRFIPGLSICGMRPPPPRNEALSLSTSSEDGVLHLHDVDYPVPWLFVRALFCDVLRAVETVLEVIVAADDSPKVDSPTKFFSSEGMHVTRMSLNLDLRMGSSS